MVSVIRRAGWAALVAAMLAAPALAADNGVPPMGGDGTRAGDTAGKANGTEGSHVANRPKDNQDAMQQNGGMHDATPGGTTGKDQTGMMGKSTAQLPEGDGTVKIMSGGGVSGKTVGHEAGNSLAPHPNRGPTPKDAAEGKW